MEQFQSAGIYVLINLTSKSDKVSHTGAWNYQLQDRFTKIVDVFETFPNVLGFSVSAAPTQLPLIKAGVRDVKHHIKTKSYRAIPVGYLGRDGEAIAFSNIYSVGSEMLS
jgi:hypothetical protein